MSIQFPNAPTQGQSFVASNGVSYTYDNGGWIANSQSALDDRYVNITGDNMTGDLTLGTDNITLRSLTDSTLGRNHGRIDIDGKNIGEDPAFTVFNSLDSDASTSNKLVITTEGGVKIGGTNTSANIELNANGKAVLKASFTAGDNFINFKNSTGSQCGRIYHDTTSSVRYDTSSDYRIKENVTTLSGSTDRVKQLNPVSFNYIGSDTVIEGFIAHEAQSVIPSAVGGKKDEVDENGQPILQGIDQSRMVALLTSALQESVTRIEALEAEVQALKGVN